MVDPRGLVPQARSARRDRTFCLLAFFLSRPTVTVEWRGFACSLSYTGLPLQRPESAHGRRRIRAARAHSDAGLRRVLTAVASSFPRKRESRTVQWVEQSEARRGSSCHRPKAMGFALSSLRAETVLRRGRQIKSGHTGEGRCPCSHRAPGWRGDRRRTFCFGGPRGSRPSSGWFYRQNAGRKRASWRLRKSRQ